MVEETEENAQEERADLTPTGQFKRFQEAAEEHEIEKRLPDIERAFDTLATHKKNEPKLVKKKTRQDG